MVKFNGLKANGMEWTKGVAKIVNTVESNDLKVSAINKLIEEEYQNWLNKVEFDEFKKFTISILFEI